MSTQQDHDEEDCPLCGGTGEVSISKDGTYEGTDYYGCPMCISRERDEEARLIKAQRDELLAVNAGLMQAARQALEAITYRIERDLEHGHEWALVERELANEAIVALREALEQPAKAAEPVFAFRRKGLDDFCTCTKKRYKELSLKPDLFETRIFYTTPQPTRQPLTEGELDLILQKSPIKANYADLTALVRAVEKAHGVGGEA